MPPDQHPRPRPPRAASGCGLRPAPAAATALRVRLLARLRRRETANDKTNRVVMLGLRPPEPPGNTGLAAFPATSGVRGSHPAAWAFPAGHCGSAPALSFSALPHPPLPTNVGPKTFCQPVCSDALSRSSFGQLHNSACLKSWCPETLAPRPLADRRARPRPFRFSFGYAPCFLSRLRRCTQPRIAAWPGCSVCGLRPQTIAPGRPSPVTPPGPRQHLTLVH